MINEPNLPGLCTAYTALPCADPAAELLEVRAGVPLVDALGEAQSVLALVDAVLQEAANGDAALSPAVCALAQRAMVHAQGIIRAAWLGADAVERRGLSEAA